jgi:predicted HTH domain antitoxin
MDKVTVTVDLPRSVCTAMGAREAELAHLIREVLAVELYRAGRLSLGKAAEVAGVTRFEMMQVLAKHDVWLAYDVHDAAADWETLREVLPK